MSVPANKRARALLRESGPTEAWQTATREAIDAHLAKDDASRDYWRAGDHAPYRGRHSCYVTRGTRRRTNEVLELDGKQ